MIRWVLILSLAAGQFLSGGWRSACVCIHGDGVVHYLAGGSESCRCRDRQHQRDHAGCDHHPSEQETPTTLDQCSSGDLAACNDDECAGECESGARDERSALVMGEGGCRHVDVSLSHWPTTARSAQPGSEVRRHEQPAGESWQMTKAVSPFAAGATGAGFALRAQQRLADNSLAVLATVRLRC